MKRLAKAVTLPSGEKFDSRAEMDRYGVLLLRQKLGEIRHLRRQVKYPLAIEGRPVKIRSPRYKNGRQCVYTADFVYEEWEACQCPIANGWRTVVEECKGYHTDASRLRIAIFEAQYGIQVRMTGAQKMRRRRRVSPDVGAAA